MDCKVLTSPSEPAGNDGHDNSNSDLILRSGMVLEDSDTEIRYVVKEMLGQGTFGQVVKCSRESGDEFMTTGRRTEGFGTGSSSNNNSHVAVKVIKNQPAYYHQALVEISVLKLLNDQHDPHDTRHIVRLIDHFVYKKHLCIVFELLTYNLFELIRQNQFRGLSLKLVRLFTKQLLDALIVLRQARVIHCDLKPENVLLKSLNGDIKLIDFGSACLENRIVYSYIQSRFYRSPEVILGHHYTSAIDMWSLGCVAAELFLGLPMFPGASEFDLMHRMVEALGNQPPDRVLRSAKNTAKYFKHCPKPTPRHPSAPIPKPTAGKGALGATLGSGTGPLSPVSENSSTKGFTLSGADDNESADTAELQGDVPEVRGNLVQGDEPLPASGIPIGRSLADSRQGETFPSESSRRRMGECNGPGAPSLAVDGADDSSSTAVNTGSASSSFDSFGHFTSSSATSPSSIFSTTSSRSASPASSAEYVLLSVEEYAEREKVRPAMGKRYFKERQLHELILTYNGLNAATGLVLGESIGEPADSGNAGSSFRNQKLKDESVKPGKEAESTPIAGGSGQRVTSGLTACITQAERAERLVFSDFLRGLIEMDPEKRWTPQQAILHPFITEIPGPLPFVPPQIPHTPVETVKGASAPGPSGVFSGPTFPPSLFNPYLSSLPSRALFTQDQSVHPKSQVPLDFVPTAQRQQAGTAVAVPVASQQQAFQARYGTHHSGPSSLPQPLTAQMFHAAYQPLVVHQVPLYYPPHPGYDGNVDLNRANGEGAGSSRVLGANTAQGGIYQGPGSMDRSYGGGSHVGFHPGSAPGVPVPMYLQGNPFHHGMGIPGGGSYPTPLDLPITSGPRLASTQQYSYSPASATSDCAPLAYHASDPCVGQGLGMSPSGLPIVSRLHSVSSQSGHQHFSPATSSPLHHGPPLVMHNSAVGGGQQFYSFQNPVALNSARTPGSLEAGRQTMSSVGPSSQDFVPLSPESYGDGPLLPQSLGSALGMSSGPQGVPVLSTSYRDTAAGYPFLPSSLGSSVGGLPDSRNNSQRLSYTEQGNGAGSTEPSPSPPMSMFHAPLSAGPAQSFDGMSFNRQPTVVGTQRIISGRLAGIPEAAGGRGSYAVVHGAEGWPHGYATSGSIPGLQPQYAEARPGSFPEGGQGYYHYIGSPAAGWQQVGSYMTGQEYRASSGIVGARGSGPGRPLQPDGMDRSGGAWQDRSSQSGETGQARCVQDTSTGQRNVEREWEEGTPPEPEDWDPYFADDILLQDGSRQGSNGGDDCAQRGVTSEQSAAGTNSGSAAYSEGRYSTQGRASDGAVLEQGFPQKSVAPWDGVNAVKGGDGSRWRIMSGGLHESASRPNGHFLNRTNGGRDDFLLSGFQNMNVRDC